MATGPSTTTDSFLLSLEPNVTFTTILTVGDALPGSTSGVFGGIPDGIGAFDNGDGTLTVIVNHEINNAQGIVRDHGSIGSYIDRIVIDKATLAVIGGDDAMQTLNVWNTATQQYEVGTTAFSRFCSGDLADQTAFLNSASGLGTSAHIYLTGEESGVEGRAVATIVSGENAGQAYVLPTLGKLAFENLTANAFAQDKTIVAATDDGQNGQVYIYVGDKQATGTDIDKAGLTNGALYGIKVTGFTDETNAVAANGSFTLEAIADAASKTGAQIDAASEAQGVTSFLRPEDSAWDPQNQNVLYFTTTNSFTGNSRLYKATFADITHPELGGSIEAVLDGSEGQKMFDNLTVANGKIILQEDPGNQDYIAKVYEYDIASDTLSTISSFDPAKFAPGAAGFITKDEESSGVIDVTNLLGDATHRAYLLDAQVHKATGDPATVEQGQLLLMKVETVHDGANGDDVLNGDATANVISGNNGNDTIRAGSGNDTLFGNNGNDVLDGMRGNDVLVGGRGDDRLTGGEGDDRFDFTAWGDNKAAIGNDVVTDFVSGHDVIVLTADAYIRKTATGDFNADGVSDLKLTVSTGGTITLLGVNSLHDGDVINQDLGELANRAFHDMVLL
ncbi:DUF839 domain-containing protein [Novosphingobium sp. KCTC 2891]|uniref:calcium-binding protein n=1 Tax=Novosphingobium sp. KCTC 2891 TaxID=2989730 RepID=UPI0022237FD0|nr:alkaline phosphatase PhoX [Novosphingobium sp. KCTC 2891]MCW1381551.1 DUF839 domain-containing protein [Novosphingobium sp. KCTC 2891]